MAVEHLLRFGFACRLSAAVRGAALAGVVAGALAGPLTAQANSWHRAADLPVPRRLLAAAELGGMVYTFGGCGSPCFAPPLHTSTFEERRVDVYDPEANAWQTRPPMPTIVFGGAAAAVPELGKIYLFGGFVTGSGTQEYEPGATPETDQWSPRRAMPTPRHGLAAVTLGHEIYVVGGSNGTTALGTLEIYDPVHDSWRPGAPMKTPRAFLAAAVLDGKLYAIGGSPNCCGNGVTDVVEIYDPGSNSWTYGPVLPQPLQTSAAAVVGGKIYVLGGFVPGEGTQDSTFELDPAVAPDSAWSPKRPMPVGKDQAPAVAVGSSIYVPGGSTNCHCRALADHRRYQPEPTPSRTADLQITKTDGVAEVCPGETVRYTIVVTNHGPDAVSGAVVHDDIPDALHATWTCTPAAIPGGASCTPAGSGPGASIDDHITLPALGSVTYTVTGTLDLGASGTLSNRAEVSVPPGFVDPVAINNRTQPDVDAIRRDRLEIRKNKVPARTAVAPPDVLRYEVTVTNRCRIPLLTRVVDRLPAAGLIEPGWCLGPSCRRLNMEDLDKEVLVPAGGSKTFTVQGKVPCDCVPPPPSPIRNVATASAPGQDTVNAEDVTPVLPGEHGLVLAVAGPDTLPLPSCGGDYTITVSNPNPCPARGVVLEVSVPPELSLVSLSAPCAGIGPCPLGVLGPAPASVTVTAHVDAAAGVQCTAAPAPIIRATARNLCAPPPAPAAEAAKAAAIPCNLAITKTSDVPDPAPGDCILYSINVANHGCGDVTGAKVSDAFPAELATAQWCRGADCLPAANGDLADTLDLPRGDSETYRVDATISPDFSGALDNSASVVMPAGIVDVLPADNIVTSSITVEPRPGIDLQCSGTKKFISEGSDVVLTFVIWNGGPLTQGDNPGDEFVYVVPAGLTLVSAAASSGSITVLPANTVHWNGAIPVDGMVTIDVRVNVDLGTAGMAFCNPATVFFDSNGDGINDSMAPTDDRCHPCCFTVTELGAIPTLSHLGLAMLALLAAAIGVARLRRRSPASPDG